MSRKKTPKGKGASAPAASALPAANGPRPALPGTARPGPGTPHNAPPQPGRPPVGSGGDFYDVAFKNKVLDVDGMKVKLSGTQLARSVSAVSLTPTTVTHMHCCCSMMSPTRPPSTTSSFPHQAWLAEIQEYAQHDVVLMLLGNKVDSAQERVVKREDGEKLAKEYGLPFMETSAKTGLNVDLAFIAIANSSVWPKTQHQYQEDGTAPPPPTHNQAGRERIAGLFGTPTLSRTRGNLGG
ncbi:ras-related protein Rab-26 isoform X12 [Manis javanica]|uniref:ras-related protein Rab-26 isoform X12 n=1 Tax=Manis javanica TaxID=9974 RepID=UPI003C6CF835